MRPAPGASPRPEALRSWCGERIARHKVPRYVWLLEEELPRNANGKFVKRALRDQLALADADDAQASPASRAG